MKTVLIVDDEKLVRDVAGMYFEAIGYKAVLAKNGEDALRKLDDSIDAVILDVMMPVMNGVDCYHEIRKAYPFLPIVMCSGYGSDLLEGELFNDPNFRFTAKPTPHQELNKIVIGMIFVAATEKAALAPAYTEGYDTGLEECK